MNKKIKIALVDDESLFLEGLSLLFQNEDHISVHITSNDGSDFLHQLSNISKHDFPEIAFVDIQMKPMNGFELVEQLKIHHPNLKVIILSSHYKNSMFGHMIKLGVSAFVPKNASKQLLLQAIDSVYKTGVFFTEKDHKMLMSYMQSKSKKPIFNSVDQLSEREKEVIKLICLEHTNQEIGDILFLSKRTIESHRQRILEKIGAKNSVGIVVYAIAHEIHPITLSY